MKEVTIEKIVEVINVSENIEVNNNQLDDNLSDMGMDSITFIQMVVNLEEVFECEIPDSKLLMSEMDTIRKVAQVLLDLYREIEGEQIKIEL